MFLHVKSHGIVSEALSCDGMPGSMASIERKREHFILYGITKLQMVDSTLATTSQLKRGFSKVITTPKGHVNHKDNDGFNLIIYVIIPIAILLFLMFLFILLFILRRKLRTRRLQRDFSPHYGYDHSEAEVFDGYTQFSEGVDGLERLGYDGSRAKVLSPSRSEQSVESVEVSTISSADSKPAGSSTPKKFVNNVYI